MNVYRRPTEEQAVVLSLDEGINSREIDELIASIDETINQETALLVIDCSGVRLMTSAGIGNILRIRKQVSPRDIELKLATVSDDLGDVLRLTRVNLLFKTYPDVDGAVSG